MPRSDGHEEPSVERVIDRPQPGLLLSKGARSLAAETMFRAAGEAGLRRGEVIRASSGPDVNLPSAALRFAAASRKSASAEAGGSRS